MVQDGFGTQSALKHMWTGTNRRCLGGLSDCTYNKAFLKTINIAYGGATAVSNLVIPYFPAVLSLKDQVQQDYLPVYANHPSFFNY